MYKIQLNEVWSWYCDEVLCIFSSLAIILLRKRERAGCFSLFVFLLTFVCLSLCSDALLCSAIGWSVIVVLSGKANLF